MQDKIETLCLRLGLLVQFLQFNIVQGESNVPNELLKKGAFFCTSRETARYRGG